MSPCATAVPMAPCDVERHPPARLAGGEGVAVQPRRAEDDQLRVGAAARREHHRRRPRHRDAGTRAAPALAAGPAIEGDHERPAHLVADQDHGVAGDDRRAGHAVEVLERPERNAPALGAVGRVGHEPDVGEEDDDALVVGDRGRRRGIVGLVQRGRAVWLDLPPPALASGRRVQTHRQQPPAFAGRHVELRADDHRGGLGEGQRRLPHDVLGRRERHRVARRGIDAGAVRAAELPPLRRRRCGSREADQEQSECSRCARLRHAGDSTPRAARRPDRRGWRAAPGSTSPGTRPPPAAPARR